MSDLFPPEQHGPYGREGFHPVRRESRKVVTTYPYLDEAGRLLYQVCRTEPKGFFQRRPDGMGGWVNNLEGVRRVLYRLPEIVQRPLQPVVVVEGEKDADLLASWGLLGATCAMGAGKWISDYSIALRGRRVTVIPDNDAPGREHAEHVAGSLMMFGASAVRVVELPGVGEGGDVSDWAALNREIDARGELISMIRQTREWRAA